MDEGGGDGESLPPMEVVKFLRRKINGEKTPVSWIILEGMLLGLGDGQPLRAQEVAKSIERSYAAQKHLSKMDEEAASSLIRVSKGMSGRAFEAAYQACMDNESQEEAGCLDPRGALAVIDAVAPALSGKTSKVVALMYLLYSSPISTLVPIPSVFKAFRAVKAKLPGTGGTLLPGTGFVASNSQMNESLGRSVNQRSICTVVWLTLSFSPLGVLPSATLTR